jgi:hypothetical protein
VRRVQTLVQLPENYSFAAPGMRLAAPTSMDDLQRLRDKLCRELAQSEHSAEVHTRREARRLGDVPPALRLLALGEHARAERAELDAVLGRRQPRENLRIAKAIGGVFSALRHLLFDRVIDTERSYRGTLLGFRHGLDTARLLREVATRQGDAQLVQFLDTWMPRRLELVHAAEAALAWFADSPRRALQSGLRIAIAPK